MPHVSSKKLSKKQSYTLNKNFTEWLNTLPKSYTAVAVQNLLTDTEQVMLAKRLSIIFLLQDGFSAYQVSRMCSVTLQTVQRLLKDKDGGRFDDLVRMWKQKKQKDEMWKMIDSFSRLGLPSYVGKDRYSKLNKNSRRG